MRAVGKYRIRHLERDENGVFVMIGDQGVEMRESSYIDNGCEPPLEELPWHERPDPSKASVKA